MKKLTCLFSALCIPTVLFSVLLVHSMEKQKELALLAEEYNSNSVCLLPNDTLAQIVVHYYDDKVESFQSTIANLMRLRQTCQSWNNLLTFENIGDLCKNYSQVIKNMVLTQLTYNSFNRFPILVVVQASIEPSIAFHKIINNLLITAACKNDIQLSEILLKHKTKVSLECLQEVKTVEMAQIFVSNDVNIDVINYFGHNILWKLFNSSYPSDLMRFYLACGVNARRLCWGGTLLHKLAREVSRIDFSDIKDVDNFLQKAELLIIIIPDMINIRCSDSDYKTPLAIVQKSLNDISSNRWSEWGKKRSQTEEILVIEALERLISLFEKNGEFTA